MVVRKITKMDLGSDPNLIGSNGLWERLANTGGRLAESDVLLPR